ncbi:MAG: cyclic peptide export ABC transporter [Saprospiraceae bacterium]
MNLLRYFHKTVSSLFYSAIIISVISGLSNAALAGLISHQIAMKTALDNNFLYSLGLIILIAVCFDFFTKQILNLLINRVVYELRMSFASQVLKAPFSQIEALGTPRLFALLTDDIQLIGNVVAQLPVICIGLATIMGCVIYLTWLSPLTLIGLVIFAIPVFIAYWLLQKKTGQLFQQVIVFRNQIYESYQSITGGIKELKLNQNRLSVFYYKHLQPLVASGKQANTNFHRYNLLAQSVNQFTYFILILGLFATSRWFDISLEILGAYAIMILYLKTATMTLVSALPLWSAAHTAIDQIESLGFTLVMPASNIHKSDANSTQSTTTNAIQIDIKALQYTYHHAEKENGFHLGPIDCQFQSGEIVFITGGNGSGKTTFLKLLIGLYASQTGQIKWNNQLVTTENIEAYRQNFAVIFAEPHLFPHLMGFTDESTNQLAQVWLQRLQLAHKVQLIDNKFSTLKLSFGQRKRLALLTAYLEDRPVYVFDEWAAGQDPEFRDFFYYTLLPELKMKGKLVIAITHDDHYFNTADRIIKFDTGQIKYGLEQVVLSHS